MDKELVYSFNIVQGYIEDIAAIISLLANGQSLSILTPNLN